MNGLNDSFLRAYQEVLPTPASKIRDIETGTGDFKSNDTTDLGRVLIRYVPAVYRLFVKKTADIELSRELCSELQLRFLKGKLTQGFDPAKGPFRFYLWRASINLLRDYFRDKRNHPIHGSLDFEPVDENEGDPFGQQDAEIHEACAEHILHCCWQELKSQEEASQTPSYSLLRLRLSGIQDYAELADRVAESMSLEPVPKAATVRQWSSRAVRKFGNLLWQLVSEEQESEDHEVIAGRIKELGLTAYCRDRLRS